VVPRGPTGVTAFGWEYSWVAGAVLSGVSERCGCGISIMDDAELFSRSAPPFGVIVGPLVHGDRGSWDEVRAA
jgi:hypothetical protein